MRVYAGCLRVGDAVLNATKGNNEQIGRLVRMFANHREDIRQIEAGMIGARRLGGRDQLATGDTLCDPRSPILLDTIAVPEPVMGVVVEPETDDDHAKLGARARAPRDRGPVVPRPHRRRVRADRDLAGWASSTSRSSSTACAASSASRPASAHPQVAYRETVTRRAEGENKFVRVAAARRPARRVRPRPARRRADGPRRRATSTRTARPPSDIPQEHAPAVEAGVTEAVERGVLAGLPMTDLRVQVVGGSYHPVDSNNYAFKVAGSKAFVAAASKAGPTLLEPVMSLEVVTPDESVGDVLGDLHARRGKVAGITARPGVQTVACFVPMASMFGYATDLRSRTRGRATYSMEFDHYAEVPQQHPRRDSDLLELARRKENVPCPKRNSSATSPTSTSARSVTSTTARPR